MVRELVQVDGDKRTLNQKTRKNLRLLLLFPD